MKPNGPGKIFFFKGRFPGSRKSMQTYALTYCGFHKNHRSSGFPAAEKSLISVYTLLHDG